MSSEKVQIGAKVENKRTHKFGIVTAIAEKIGIEIDGKVSQVSHTTFNRWFKLCEAGNASDNSNNNKKDLEEDVNMEDNQNQNNENVDNKKEEGSNEQVQETSTVSKKQVAIDIMNKLIAKVKEVIPEAVQKETEAYTSLNAPKCFVQFTPMKKGLQIFTLAVSNIPEDFNVKSHASTGWILDTEFFIHTEDQIDKALEIVKASYAARQERDNKKKKPEDAESNKSEESNSQEDQNQDGQN